MNDMEKISKLPGKDVLVGKIIGSMKSPISRFTMGIKFNQQKLVYILSQKAQQG
jgi:ribosomal protein L10